MRKTVNNTLQTVLDDPTLHLNEKQKQFFTRITNQRDKLYSSPELCLERIKEHKIVLEYIPKEFWQNPDFCRQAREYIPEEENLAKARRRKGMETLRLCESTLGSKIRRNNA